MSATRKNWRYLGEQGYAPIAESRATRLTDTADVPDAERPKTDFHFARHTESNKVGTGNETNETMRYLSVAIAWAATAWAAVHIGGTWSGGVVVVFGTAICFGILTDGKEAKK